MALLSVWSWGREIAPLARLPLGDLPRPVVGLCLTGPHPRTAGALQTEGPLILREWHASPGGRGAPWLTRAQDATSLVSPGTAVGPQMMTVCVQELITQKYF